MATQPPAIATYCPGGTTTRTFSVSLDGSGTGEGQSLDAPFGHAGERLHEWMFAARWGP